MNDSIHQANPPLKRPFLGIISDTHGLVRPEACEALRGADLLLHAGDIGAPQVLNELGEIAPVQCVRGNVDFDRWAKDLPLRQRVEWGGLNILILHNVSDLRLSPAESDIDIVVFGHSHEPIVEQRGDCLFVNPGSAGPRRFSLPICVARLELSGGKPKVELIHLAV